MTEPNYPSADPRHRFADLVVHRIGLALILCAGSALILRAAFGLEPVMTAATALYVAAALASNLSSTAYHFSGRHEARVRLRRIDHAAIYPSITGTFTPLFLQAGTDWTLGLMALSWAVTAVAVAHKIRGATVKGRWSTASYLGLGAIGLAALPDMGGMPAAVGWCVIAGAACYLIGVGFYTRRTMPFRYAIWHVWVNFGAILMFAAVWLALFPAG